MAAIRKVLPGFQLTLGYTLFYLLLICAHCFMWTDSTSTGYITYGGSVAPEVLALVNACL